MTEQVKHTPGPWTVCGEKRGVCQCVTVLCDSYPVAKAFSGDWGDDYPSLRFVAETGGEGSISPKIEAYMEQITYGSINEDVAKANARLIAAAPDMFAVLEDILILAGPYDLPADLMARARTAIAKAEGRADPQSAKMEESNG